MTMVAVTTVAVTQAQTSPQFWAGREVFVTGHTGFKGAWLSLLLQQMGACVTGLSLAPPSSPNLFDSAQIADGMTSVIGDIRDYELLAAALKKSQASVVFHLAAQAIVAEGYRAARETFATNLMGTVNLLDAIRAASNVKAAVIVTSDKCYAPSGSERSLVEGDPLGGKDPYSASKSCAEIATASWRTSFFEGAQAKQIATARAGNVIGGGDWSAHRLLPDIMRAFLANAPLVLRMPNAIRPWQHVLDALSGYLILAEKMCADRGADFAQAWNFGPVAADHLTARNVAERCAQLWGDAAKIEIAENNFQIETPALRLDATRAREILGWQPHWTADDALRHTVAWYRQWKMRAADPQAIRDLTLQQIQQFGTAH